MTTGVAPHSSHQRPSGLLRDLASCPRSDVTVQDIVQLLGDRSFGATMLVFAVPVLLPLPPGSSFVLGAPLILIAAQLMLGRRMLWLPRFVGSWRIPLGRMRQPLGRAAAAMAWIEGFLKSRHPLFCTPRADRLTGAACFLLSLVLFLPIPLASLVPAFALTIFALGLLRQDGVMIASGWVCCILERFPIRLHRNLRRRSSWRIRPA